MAEFWTVTPPQPDKPMYPASELQLSPRLTRALYFALFGEQAPAWDSRQPIKRWFFTDAVKGATDPENELVQYKVFDEVTGQIQTLTMTKADAAKPNLPGTVTYPKYAKPESTVAVTVGFGATAPVNPAILVDVDTAKAVAAEINAALGSKFVVEISTGTWPQKIVYGNETKRVCTFVDGDKRLDAAMLVSERFRAGVGAPGKWVSSEQNRSATFIPDVPETGEMDTRPEIPIPIRDLLPNERIEKIGDVTGTHYRLVRTDMREPVQSAGTGSGLTEAQAALLTRIAADLETIKAWLGVEKGEG